MDAPNLAGFRDAQDRLRTYMGTLATFHIPNAPTWAPDEPIDPETGRPYDPFAVPVDGTGGNRDEQARVVVVNAIPGPNADTVNATPIGAIPSDSIALDLSIVDEPRIRAATSVTVFGRPYKIDEIRPDGLREPERFMVFCEKL